MDNNVNIEETKMLFLQKHNSCDIFEIIFLILFHGNYD